MRLEIRFVVDWRCLRLIALVHFFIFKMSVLFLIIFRTDSFFFVLQPIMAARLVLGVFLDGGWCDLNIFRMVFGHFCLRKFVI